MKKIILYDDYNNVIPKNQDIIGTVHPMFSRTALRASWKIIEYEDEQDEELYQLCIERQGQD